MTHYATIYLTFKGTVIDSIAVDAMHDDEVLSAQEIKYSILDEIDEHSILDKVNEELKFDMANLNMKARILGNTVMIERNVAVESITGLAEATEDFARSIQEFNRKAEMLISDLMHDYDIEY